jgi:predicted lipoprotein
VTKDLVTAHLVGKTVSFVGAFSLDDPSTIIIAPVKMDVTG